MAQPTPIQRDYLLLIGAARGRGALFATGAIVIFATNIPDVLREPGRGVSVLAVAVTFVLLGLAVYGVAPSVGRRYREHIAPQLD